MGRARASIGLLVGAIALIGGLALRVLLFIGAPDVPRDDAVMFSALALTAGALLAGWVSRPEGRVLVDLGVWPLAGIGAILMPILAIFTPSLRPVYLPAGLECAGAVAFLVAYVRLARVRASLKLTPRELDTKQKAKLYREGQSKRPEVPVASLVKGDRILCPMEAELPVDGKVVAGTGFVDESPLAGPGLPAAKKPGQYVFAGTIPSIPDMEIETGAAQDHALILEKERHAKKVGDELTASAGAGKVAAVWLLLLSLSAVGIAVWRTGDLTKLDVWLPAATAVCAATAMAAPSLSIALGRLSLVMYLRRSGWFVTRAKDVLALTHVRRWQIDPRLLAAPGAVEVVELADVGGDTLLAVAEAVLREEEDAPERGSLKKAMDDKKLEALEGAAHKKTDGVVYATVNGRRWFVGGEAAIEKAEGHEIEDATQGTLEFLREQKGVVYLIGNDGDGIVGAVGIDFEADHEAKKTAGTLEATLMPGLPDATRKAIAAPAGLDIDGPPAKSRDATILAENTDPPSSGLRVRVVSPRPGMPIKEGAPRIFVSRLSKLPEVVAGLEKISKTSRRRAWLTTLAPPILLIALAFAGWLQPWAGVTVGLITVVYAARIPKGPPEKVVES